MNEHGTQGKIKKGERMKKDFEQIKKDHYWDDVDDVSNALCYNPRDIEFNDYDNLEQSKGKWMEDYKEFAYFCGAHIALANCVKVLRSENLLRVFLENLFDGLGEYNDTYSEFTVKVSPDEED